MSPSLKMFTYKLDIQGSLYVDFIFISPTKGGKFKHLSLMKILEPILKNDATSQIKTINFED